MRDLACFSAIYLYRGVMDMRKGIDGLAAVVEQEMKLDLFKEAAFIFCSRSRDLVKLLYWDKSGFALWQKRLEKERFVWPRKLTGDTIELSSQQIAWLLEGYDIKHFKPHRTLHYQSFS